MRDGRKKHVYILEMVPTPLSRDFSKKSQGRHC